MKHFIAPLLALVVLYQSSVKTLILSNYLLNKDAITKNYCINKNKPAMHCNGKCHLKKQIQKQESKENLPPLKLKQNEEINLFSLSNTEHCFYSLCHKKIRNFYFSKKYGSPSFDIFHPPQA